jgi:hypothetical protein
LKRVACNVEQVFDELCGEITKDVEAVNLSRKFKDYDLFSANVLSDHSTIVIGQPLHVPRVVVKIGIAGEAIAVSDASRKTDWVAKVCLNSEGRCILKLQDGTELERWQFRKRALEHLFFGD